MTCAVYCRLSKEDRDGSQESESIQNQKNLLTNYALQQGWDIHRIYSDDDYSGADAHRPQWQAMLRDAQNGLFQIVLCKTQSRFTRDLAMVEKYIHGLFPLWGIRFVAVVDNIDTSRKGNKKARQINGLINEWYLEDLSENIRAVFQQKRREGKYIGSFAAYGYQKDPSDHNRLVVDPESAAHVREIFRLYLEGMGTRRIADHLNQLGLPSPGSYSGRQPGCGWSGTAVSRILKNELYTGVMVQGTKKKISYKSAKLASVPPRDWVRVPGTHEAIITPQVFDAARRRLASHVRSDGRGSPHLLAGKVFCAGCGSRMNRISHTYNSRRKSYLQCKLYAATRKTPQCTGHTVRLEALTDLVCQKISQLVRLHLSQEQLAQWTSSPSSPRSGENRLAFLRCREQSLQKAQKDLYLDKSQGLISPEQFMELNNALAADREALACQIQAGQSPACQPPVPPTLDSLFAPDKISPALVDLLIRRIDIGEKDPSSGIQPLQIYWKV